MAVRRYALSSGFAVKFGDRALNERRLSRPPFAPAKNVGTPFSKLTGGVFDDWILPSAAGMFHITAIRDSLILLCLR